MHPGHEVGVDESFQLHEICHMEVEDYEDIAKNGWLAIRGDVPATLMAFGTPDEVSAYCEDLIQMALNGSGGLVLGSGCEIPLNCKLENLQAMMDSVRK